MQSESAPRAQGTFAQAQTGSPGSASLLALSKVCLALSLSPLQYVEDNLGVMSVGFLLSSPDDAVIWRGPKKNGLSLCSPCPCILGLTSHRVTCWALEGAGLCPGLEGAQASRARQVLTRAAPAVCTPVSLCHPSRSLVGESPAKCQLPSRDF